MPYRACLGAAGVLLLTGVAPLAAQGVPARTLGAPDAEFDAESFDQVAAVRELRDGRVLVADRQARKVALVDFGKGTRTDIGREGSGPGEYQLPAGLLALGGDSTLVVDPLNTRLLLLGPDGQPKGTVALPGSFGMLAGFKGVDRQGRIYGTGPRFAVGRDGALNIPSNGNIVAADTVPLVRWMRGTEKTDTVGWIQGPSTRINISGGGNNRSVMIRQQPFTPQDDWAVTPDGAIGVAKVADYHVEWWSGGKRTVGAPVPFTPIKVTQADKDQVLAAMRNPRNRMVVTRGGPPPGGREPSAPPIQEPDWPETKPAFPQGGVLASPAGELWVQRSGTAGQAVTYDIFDARGARTRQVTLPARHRVIGFGAQALYAVRTDEDDLQWLVRYRMP